MHTYTVSLYIMHTYTVSLYIIHTYTVSLYIMHTYTSILCIVNTLLYSQSVSLPIFLMVITYNSDSFCISFRRRHASYSVLCDLVTPPIYRFLSVDPDIIHKIRSALNVAADSDSINAIAQEMLPQVTNLSLSLSVWTHDSCTVVTSRNVTRTKRFSCPRTRLISYTVLTASPSPEVFTAEIVVLLPTARVFKQFCFTWNGPFCVVSLARTVN